MIDSELKECREILYNVIHQACWYSNSSDTGILDSMALSYYGDAIRYLAKHGYVKIISEYGRRVIAKEIDENEREKKIE